MSHLRITVTVQVRERNVNMALATTDIFPSSAKGAEFTQSATGRIDLFAPAHFGLSA